MKKAASFSYTAFFTLFILFISMVLLISARSILSLGHIAASLLILFAVVSGFYLLTRLKSEGWLYPIVSIASGTVFKLLCLIFLGGKMEMKYDYLTALESARGIFAEKELIYAHWAVYPKILAVFMKIFGSGYTQAVLFNVLISALSVLMIYLAAENAFGSKRIAFISSLIFSIWPSLNFYNLITSNEHLAILFALFSVFFLQSALSALKEKGFRTYIFFAAAGICLGLVDFFKQFSIVFYIALGISGLIWLFIRNREITVKKLFPAAAGFMLMLGLSLGCKEAVFNMLDNYYGEPVCRSANAHFIYMGLNSTGNGVWDDRVGFDFWNLSKEYDGDYERASKELFTVLKEDIKQNTDKLPSTIRHKMLVDWSADTGVTDWVSWLYKGGSEPMPGVRILYVISASYYFAVMLLTLASGITALRKKRFYLLLFSLISFGFALLLVLTEAQGRYQLVLFPWFSILTAYSAVQLSDLLKAKTRHRLQLLK